MLGGAYIRREVCVSKSARLMLGGKFASQNRLGQLIVERKFMSVICRKFLLKLALRTQTFVKRSHARTLSKNRGNPSQLRKQQTVTLSGCNHLAHVIVVWQIQKLYVTVPFLLCFIFSYISRQFSKYKSPGAYIRRGDLTEGFCVTSLAFFWGGGGVIFGGAFF